MDEREELYWRNLGAEAINREMERLIALFLIKHNIPILIPLKKAV